MILLLVDTAGASGGVLLAQSDCDVSLRARILGQRTITNREYSSRLTADIHELLDEVGVPLTQVDAFAAVTGPGSFTGVRVGLAAVKGMAEALGRSVVGVSRLRILVAKGLSSCSSDRTTQVACAVLEAGRGEFYCGEYLGCRQVSESLRTLPEMQQYLASATGPLFACESSVVNALCGGNRIFGLDPLSVADALGPAIEELRAGGAMDPAALIANYVRPLSFHAQSGSRVAQQGSGLEP